MGRQRGLSGVSGELDAEDVADVDLGVLGEPGTGGHLIEHRGQPVVGGLGEMDDAPQVQWL
jgi:hypothetical protein